MFDNKYLHLVWLMRNERCSRNELEDIQSKKLRSLVRHAYENVKFYKDLFQKSGLHPRHIQSVDDLGKIPIVDKSDFHRHDYPALLDGRIGSIERLITVQTSGSSGVSLKFYIDRSYNQFRRAQYLRPYLTNGRKLMDRVVRLKNMEIPHKKWFQYIGLLPEYSIYSDSTLDDQLKMIKKINPSILQGYGSCFGLLASKILEDGISISKPRIVFTDSELLSEPLRRQIEKAFGAEVIDVYGTFETENIAYECAKHEGYHIASDCVIMEFIKDGKKVGPDEEGEIVCTVLDNWTMPFIRYNLHDAGSYTDKPCSCGRTFPLMNVIAGRTVDYAVCEGGHKKSPTTFLGRLVPLAEFTREYQIIQKEVKSFKVFVVPLREFDPEIERMIKENLWKVFPESTVDIQWVDKIGRSPSGKFRVFISEVGEKISGNGNGEDLQP